MPRLSALALALIVSALLIACQETDPTELPKPTVTPTTTAQPTATASPTSTPTPLPTPTPTTVPLLVSTDNVQSLRAIEDYSDKCGMIFPDYWRPGGRWERLFDDQVTWGQFTQDIDRLLEELDQLDPPEEVAEYHDANLEAWRNLRDTAKVRPAGDLLHLDRSAFVGELFMELWFIIADAAVADEEKALLFEEIPRQRLAAFIGQDAYTADKAAQELLGSFPLLTGRTLYRCNHPMLVLDLTEKMRSAESLHSDSTKADLIPLVALYLATDGPHWINSTNWLSDAPPTYWERLRTDTRGRVFSLNLSRNGLSGEIPTEVGNILRLRTLAFAENRLNGRIPAELGNLMQLETLDLAGNQLSGEIPAELGNLLQLEFLNLTNNRLSGEIPAELENLVNLRWLTLAGNQFSGCIPNALAEIRKNDLDELGLPFCE